MRRNDKILTFALRGWTLREVGIVFGITPERVKQIAVKTVRKYDENIYYSVLERYKTGSIKEFRKHKNRLLHIITSQEKP